MGKPADWIQVGELAKGITENILPPSDGLAGRTFRLNLEDGSRWELIFRDAGTLEWNINKGADRGEQGRAGYVATCPREQIFFVDYIHPRAAATAVSLVMDLNRNIATALIGQLPGEATARQDLFSRIEGNTELTAVDAKFLSAAVDGGYTDQTPRHMPTTELVGKRVQYVYSRTEAYEHIYLNENLYTWHCLAGVEQGLADTDRCHHYKIADQLYLFVWREKLVPTMGVVIIDMQQKKTTGKLFGYETNDFGKLTNAPVGAYATVLNVTRHA